MLAGPLANAAEQVSDTFVGVCDKLAIFFRLKNLSQMGERYHDMSWTIKMTGLRTC